MITLVLGKKRQQNEVLDSSAPFVYIYFKHSILYRKRKDRSAAVNIKWHSLHFRECVVCVCKQISRDSDGLSGKCKQSKQQRIKKEEVQQQLAFVAGDLRGRIGQFKCVLMFFFAECIATLCCCFRGEIAVYRYLVSHCLPLAPLQQLVLDSGCAAVQWRISELKHGPGGGTRCRRGWRCSRGTTWLTVIYFDSKKSFNISRGNRCFNT